MSRAVLISRSECWIRLGFPEQALMDAERALILVSATRRVFLVVVDLWFGGNQWKKDENPELEDDGIPEDYMTQAKGTYVQPGTVAEDTGEVKPEKKLPPNKKDSYKGMLAKAEALYAATDFEHALVFYHRGHADRPDVDAFRLGIQKCRQAIVNAIGDPSSHQLSTVGEKEFLAEMRERKDEIEQKKRRKKDPATDPDLFNEGLQLLSETPEEGGKLEPVIIPKLEIAALKSGERRVHPEVARRYVAWSHASNHSPCVRCRVASSGMNLGAGTKTASFSQKRDITTIYRKAAEKDDPVVAREDRKLLGQLSDDKVYLSKLLLDKGTFLFVAFWNFFSGPLQIFKWLWQKTRT